ncbi:unnamed protein product, partial [Effrenium voratum]
EAPAKRRATCWYWEQGRCQMGRACSFVHPEEKAEPCWYFQQGNCSKGASCAFSHEGFQQLLQQPSSPVADEELVKVPSHLAKSLIGRYEATRAGPGGENFRLLQQVTGCQPVLVAAKDAGENEYCVVKLWGIPSHRVQARQLVEQHCKSEQKVKPMKEQAEGPIGKSLGRMGVGDGDAWAGSRKRISRPHPCDQPVCKTVSRSGVQSAMSLGFSEGGMRDLFAPVKAQSEITEGSDILAAARRVADQASHSGVSGTSESPAKLTELFAAEGSGDLLAARAARASNSGVQSSVRSAGPKAMSELFRPRAIVAPPQPEDASEASVDMFSFARAAAAEASRSGVTAASAATGTGIKELFAPPRRAGKASPKALAAPQALPQPEASDAGLSDLFASARAAAAEASRSGVQSSVAGSVAGNVADLFGKPKAGKASRAPAPVAPKAPSEISDGSDLLGAAQLAAQQASRSGVQSSLGGAAAANLQEVFTAQPKPKTQAKAPPKEPSVVSESDLFAAAQKAAEEPSVVSDGDLLAVAARAAQGDASSVGGSDLLAIANRAAAETSRSGVQSSVAGAHMADLFAPKGGDMLAAAHSAAGEFSVSGVGSSDILGAARLAARDVSQSGVGSDLYGAARAAALEASNSGVSAATAAVLFAQRKRDFEFAPPRRQAHAEGRHGAVSDAPWAAPAPPRAAKAPEPPPDPPPLPNRTFLTDPKDSEEGQLEEEEFDVDGLFIQRARPQDSAPRPPGVAPPPGSAPTVTAAAATAAAAAARPRPAPPIGTCQVPDSPSAAAAGSPRFALSPRLSPERQQMLEQRRRTVREDARDYKRKHSRVGEASRSPTASGASPSSPSGS